MELRISCVLPDACFINVPLENTADMLDNDSLSKVINEAVKKIKQAFPNYQISGNGILKIKGESAVSICIKKDKDEHLIHDLFNFGFRTSEEETIVIPKKI